FVRYQPDLKNGETATFTFRAWDQTSGSASVSNGSTVTLNYGNATVNGTTTAFSTGTAQARIVVTNVNDVPNVAADNASVTFNEGQTATNTGTYSDVDNGQNVTI